MRAFPACIVFILAFTDVGLAWSAAGQKIIASIAFRQLARDEQIRVVAILKQHPRFDEDFTRLMPDEIGSVAEEGQDESMFSAGFDLA